MVFVRVHCFDISVSVEILDRSVFEQRSRFKYRKILSTYHYVSSKCSRSGIAIRNSTAFACDFWNFKMFAHFVVGSFEREGGEKR